MSVEALVRHRRLASLLAGLFCLGLVAYAIWLQNTQGLNPCPLCIFQRVGVASLGVALILAALPTARLRWALYTVSVLVGLAALATAGVAIRHLYIQAQPPGSVPACGATLDYLMDVFTPVEVLRKVLTGSGECAKVDWTFLGLAMPAWVLIWALLLGALGVLANWPRRVFPATTA
jgi:disulfide bond formation protein DsbB